MNWKLKLHPRRGHRYFEELEGGEKTGRIGVADESGRTPDTTEDGVLYLDPKRMISVGDWDGDAKPFGSVPVVSPSGDQLWVMETPAGALEIAAEFGLDVALKGSVVGLLFSFDKLRKARPRGIHFPETAGEADEFGEPWEAGK